MSSQIAPTRVLVCIPTYDEAEDIAGTITAIRAEQPDADVLVVDDASPDGTGRIADAIAARDGRVHVLHRRGRSGLGPAYLAAFAWGRARGYQVLVEMDADGSHRPEDLGALLGQISAGADVALGSRWIDGGEVVDRPRHREWISRAGNRYARVVLRLPLHDSTGGFRAYRTQVIAAVDVDGVAGQGCCFQVDLARRAIEHGFTVVEVPIVFRDRVAGSSTMSGRIVGEALRRVTVRGLRASIRRSRNSLTRGRIASRRSR